jgi:hypothetical protein
MHLPFKRLLPAAIKSLNRQLFITQRGEKKRAK